MKTSLRKAFKASPKLEKEGIMFEMGNTRVKLARAGGTNEKYNAAMTTIAEKHKRALANNLLTGDQQKRVLYEVYAEHVVISWETDVGSDDSPKWVEGIDDGNGGVIEASFDNIVKTFEDMPDFWIECKNVAENVQYYRESLLKNVSGN